MYKRYDEIIGEKRKREICSMIVFRYSERKPSDVANDVCWKRRVQSRRGHIIVKGFGCASILSAIDNGKYLDEWE